MLTKFFKILFICVILGGLLYTGACVYSNFLQGEFALPQGVKAEYAVTIKNSGNVLYTKAYSTNGSDIILNGYWELTKGKYKYHDNVITLDQDIFGEIIIRRR